MRSFPNLWRVAAAPLAARGSRRAGEITGDPDQDRNWRLHAVDEAGEMLALPFNLPFSFKAEFSAGPRPFGLRPLFMVHGLDYDPRLGAGQGANPFETLFRLPEIGEGDRKRFGRKTPWLTGAHGRYSGPILQFAWPSNPFGWKSREEVARAALRGEITYQAAHRRSRDAAQAFGRLLWRASAHSDGEQADFCDVDIIAHSLGTRVALLAACEIAEKANYHGRLFLLHGVAEHALVDRLRAAPGWRGQVINITSRHDSIVVVWAYLLHQMMGASTNVIGAEGGPSTTKNAADWIDLQLDRPEMLVWSEQHLAQPLSGTAWESHDIDAHWAAYAAGGNRDFLWQMLSGEAFEDIAALRTQSIVEGVDRAAPVGLVRHRLQVTLDRVENRGREGMLEVGNLISQIRRTGENVLGDAVHHREEMKKRLSKLIDEIWPK